MAIRAKLGAAVGTAVAVMAVSVLGVAVAAGYGQSSGGIGPGLENRWGPGPALENQWGPGPGAPAVAGRYGEPSGGEGPGLENRWGPASGAGKPVASGEQNQNQYDKRYQSEYGRLALAGDCTGNQDRLQEGQRKHWI